jgi:FkbM family methyltransferase
MFVTYAQNLEDVMLRRALADVEHGFYIDVGACEPEAHSVTKAFYDAGWHGINIEPMPESFARLRAARSRDINLNIALEDKPALEKTYYAIDGGNGMSSGWPAVAEKLAGEGSRVDEIPTEVRTLTEVCAEHVTGPIHFLKIDVEGYERLVVQGGNFTRWRPWIILLESTLKRADGFYPFHDDMLKAGYEYTYFDGINSWYVATEHAERLRPKFDHPPGLFDSYITAEEFGIRQALVEVAQIVGLSAGAPAVEVLERVRALYRDRIHFEHEARRHFDTTS